MGGDYKVIDFRGVRQMVFGLSKGDLREQVITAGKRLAEALQMVKDRDAQIAQLTEAQRAFTVMNAEFNRLGMYLRQHYQNEIALGHHQGRSLSDVVIGYLDHKMPGAVQ